VELTVNARNKDEAREIVKDACDKLICNPIMEDYGVTLEEIG
jgi:phosphoribosylformylglycinamidine synthase